MSSNDPSPIRFRPSKKRKTYRQRPTSPDETATPALEPRARATAADYFDSKPSPEDVEPAVVRAAARPSRRGVGFGSTPRPSENDEQRLVVREERETGMGDRFVKYTDDRTVVDDRHMFVCPHWELWIRMVGLTCKERVHRIAPIFPQRRDQLRSQGIGLRCGG